MRHPPQGIYAILYAFFDQRGRLDRGAMRAQTQWCIERRVHGLAVLGLATEVNKLAGEEKRQLIDWLAQDNAGALPWAVTISGRTRREQIALARHAREAGARWLILQPPAGRTKIAEDALADFFADVMDQAQLPCAIQNAPEYLGVGLSPAAIRALRTRCSNFSLLKGEGPAVLMAETIRANRGLRVFNGRGGLELVDNLRAGCAGMIIAPELADHQVAIHESFRAGNLAQADARYREILPAVLFIMQSLAHLVCYGKRLAARRLALRTVHDRAPAMAPTAFGLRTLQRLGDEIEALAPRR